MVHVSQGSCTLLSHQHRSDPCKMCTGQIHETNDWSNIDMFAMCSFIITATVFFSNTVCTSHKGMKYIRYALHIYTYICSIGSFSKIVAE